MLLQLRLQPRPRISTDDVLQLFCSTLNLFIVSKVCNMCKKHFLRAKYMQYAHGGCTDTTAGIACTTLAGSEATQLYRSPTGMRLLGRTATRVEK